MNHSIIDINNIKTFSKIIKRSNKLVTRTTAHKNNGLVNEIKRPGENGQPYNIDKNKLSIKEKEEYKRGWQKHQFNLFASDRISVRRTLPDQRTKTCKNQRYNSKMLSTSIIIVFHNEAWSTLIRTVHSIIDRSPSKLIKEIILVDDGSTMDHLGQPLQSYMDLIEKVKIIRTKTRLGLMKARIMGATETSGDILTFLDAHIECYPGWLEPLLSRVSENETNVVCPVIDIINDETFETYFQKKQNIPVGVFDWEMDFNWKIPSELKRYISNLNSPFSSPVMAGGLFSIRRSYFYNLGTYDTGMKIWGSENIEMSFRIWMCGGKLEIIPCSHVAHIFRKISPYNWGDSVEKIIVVNKRRLVDVWLDEYKEIYYTLTGNQKKYNRGDISSRLSLKRQLNCKPFTWYLKNIYPELFNPMETQFIGSIQSLALKGICFDSGGKKSASPILYRCHNQGGNQLWFITNDGYLRNIYRCLVNFELDLGSCDNLNDGGWKYDHKNSIISDTGLNCLTIFNDELTVEKCSMTFSNINQKWILKSNNNYKLKGLNFS